MTSLQKGICLKRTTKNIDDETTVSYDVTSLEKLEDFGNENEKSSLTIFYFVAIFLIQIIVFLNFIIQLKV